MTFRGVLAQATVRDLPAAERWYTTLFGRRPDARPMDGLLEWHLTGGSGVQVWVEPPRAGGSTVVLDVDGLDEVAARLRGDGIDHPGPEQATSSRVLRLTDPDGNRVVLTGG
ncbi:VOC family protein [Geodermatophilus marinus]|uniref:VOC family protein n=1 Tax=Geodermatophilus sp. LHW52908 TaxID=2303986 RepID=UPI000E3E491A|nr:VOC family protein [Geodermatophilus sp. LHW52908]RFU20745.1 VOC family protein [Geodermatophilus sp. LHW52908]